MTPITNSRPKPTAESPQNILLNNGYDYDAIYQQAVAFGFIPHIHPIGDANKVLQTAQKSRRR